MRETDNERALREDEAERGALLHEDGQVRARERSRQASAWAESQATRALETELIKLVFAHQGPPSFVPDGENKVLDDNIDYARRVARYIAQSQQAHYKTDSYFHADLPFHEPPEDSVAVTTGDPAKDQAREVLPVGDIAQAIDAIPTTPDEET